MKIGIIGANGFVGEHLRKYFDGYAEVVTFSRTGGVDEEIDLEHMERFNFESLKDINFIIFLAAISNPDMCEKEFERCWKINVDMTQRFIEMAAEMGCKVLFFSSDAVYGRVEKKYDERCECKPYTAYGKMKRAIEERFERNPNVKCLRLSYIVARDDKFMNYLMGCIERRRSAEIFHPFYRNCITMHEVEAVVSYMINNWEKCNEYIYNVSGDELVSRLRIVDELNRLLDTKIHYEVVEPEPSFFENRPQITEVSNSLIKDFGVIDSKSFSERLREEIGG